jgi:hypothetical protein
MGTREHPGVLVLVKPFRHKGSEHRRPFGSLSQNAF